jgi:hypothetical protein
MTTSKADSLNQFVILTLSEPKWKNLLLVRGITIQARFSASSHSFPTRFSRASGDW